MVFDLGFCGVLTQVAALLVTLSGCYRIPRTTFPDGAGVGDDGDRGSGGAGGGGSGATGTGGASGTGGSGATGAQTGRGGGTAGGGGAGGEAGAAGGGNTTCAPVCDSSHICVGDRCLLIDGSPCTVSSQCASNLCSPWFQDRDGDGYGAGIVTGACGNAPPIGYVATAGDCCDDPASGIAKLIHPGADYQANSANGICGVTWDYDCDGRVETSPMACSDCTVGSCKCIYTDYPESSCGQTLGFYPDDCFPLTNTDGCNTATYYSASAVKCR